MRFISSHSPAICLFLRLSLRLSFLKPERLHQIGQNLNHPERLGAEPFPDMLGRRVDLHVTQQPAQGHEYLGVMCNQESVTHLRKITSLEVCNVSCPQRSVLGYLDGQVVTNRIWSMPSRFQSRGKKKKTVWEHQTCDHRDRLIVA